MPMAMAGLAKDLSGRILPSNVETGNLFLLLQH